MSDPGLVRALLLAPRGARCMVKGFEAWSRTHAGWINRESFVQATCEELADLMDLARAL